MNIRIYNARLLPMADSMEVTTGEVWITDDRIARIGSCRSEQAPSWDREIDAEGNLVMPGFKNAHTHSAMTFLRSYADDLPLQEWLTQQIFPMEAKLTGEDMYHLSKLANLEYLTSGITANFDMYLDAPQVARASEEMGFRTVLVSAASNFNPDLEKVEDWYRTINTGSSLTSFVFGLHAEYTSSHEIMCALGELAHKYRAPVYAHNSETASEVAECIQRYGKTPTRVMKDCGLFNYGGGGYHCVYMSGEDLEIFREMGLYAVTNPGSNTKLASGIAPIADMLDAGIPIAIGTDGPASNNCLDMFREMFLVTGLAKLRQKDAAAVPATEVLRMAAVNGARAMGLSDCDCLAPGKKADLIILDLHQPNMQPLNNIAKNIVYSGSKQNVLLTMVDGRILYERGTFHVGIDPEEVYAKANETIARFCRS